MSKDRADVDRVDTKAPVRPHQGEGPSRGEWGGTGGAGPGPPKAGAPSGLQAGRWAAHMVVTMLGAGVWELSPGSPLAALPAWPEHRQGAQPLAGGTGGWCWVQCPRPGHRSIGAFWAQGPLLPTRYHPESTGGLKALLGEVSPLSSFWVVHSAAGHKQPSPASLLVNEQLATASSLARALPGAGAGTWKAWPCCDGDTLGRQWPHQGPIPAPPPAITLQREWPRAPGGLGVQFQQGLSSACPQPHACSLF